MGEEVSRLDLDRLKKATERVFFNLSDNSKQKLVYQLLEYVKNRDQSKFFWALLKTINQPREYGELRAVLNEYYDVLPDEIFINFAYSIILGIMATYKAVDTNE
ncbi:MAG: hypothetical protein QXZ59_04120 [Nitrososphaeria archaeon]